MIAKSLLALTALLVRHCIALAPASFCLLVPTDPSLEKHDEDVYTQRMKVISQLTKQCCNAEVWQPNRMHYSNSFLYNDTQVDGLGVCKGYELYETPGAAERFEDTCKTVVKDQKFFARCCNFDDDGCLDKKGVYTPDPGDFENPEGQLLMVDGPTYTPSGDPETCKHKVPKGCYGICFDENGWSGVSANEATKHACHNTPGADGDGHYIKGLGRGTCGDGPTGACIWADKVKDSNTTCTTSFVQKFEAECKKYAGKDYTGQIYAPDGSTAYLSNGTEIVLTDPK